MQGELLDNTQETKNMGGERDIDITISERYTFDFTKNSQYQVFQKPEIYIYILISVFSPPFKSENL